jgi:hypothetical protein
MFAQYIVGFVKENILLFPMAENIFYQVIDRP